MNDNADIIATKGLDNISVDELIAELTPKGRGGGCYLVAIWYILLLFDTFCCYLIHFVAIWYILLLLAVVC